MRRLLLLLALAPGCFEDAPDLDPADDGMVEGSSDEAGDLESSSEWSSSSGGELSWEDAYGPCEVAEDCPIIPGDDGLVATEVRCFQGTCSPKCGDTNVTACPGYVALSGDGYYPIACGSTGFCSVEHPWSEEDSGWCPEGMLRGDPNATPPLGCVWDPSND